MGTSLAKVLHTIGRRSMLCHVLACIEQLGTRYTIAETLVVHDPDQQELFEENITLELPDFAPSVGYALQQEQLGTGHAVQCGVQQFSANHPLLVLFGDQPLMQKTGVENMIMALNENALCLSTFQPPDPTGLGRVVLDTDNKVSAIVEEKDANPEQKQITLCNSGIMAIAPAALELLPQLSNNNAAKEYYLTELVTLARKEDLSVQHCVFPAHEMASVNTLAELSSAEAIWQQGARLKHLQAGVQMLAPETVYFSVDTEIGAGTFIEPNVVFGRGVRIESNTKILAFSHIEQAHIGAKCQIGPFSRIRPQSVIDHDVRVGNFVEIKNAHLESRTRAGHLAYLGDCRIEPDVNIGAGTITCNFDGLKKNRTHIGRNAFIGSNSSLVAPVHIGKDCVVGAGSVISNSVPDYALTLERNRQLIVNNGAKRLRERETAKEEKPEDAS